MKYLRKLLNAKIALATIANITQILLVTGLVTGDNVNTITKVATLIIGTLIQVGVMTNAEE